MPKLVRLENEQIEISYSKNSASLNVMTSSKYPIDVDLKLIPYEVYFSGFVGGAPHNMTRAQLDKDCSPNKKRKTTWHLL